MKGNLPFRIMAGSLILERAGIRNHIWLMPRSDSMLINIIQSQQFEVLKD
jgi:hypothetical protein